jgi:hypothetical protein
MPSLVLQPNSDGTHGGEYDLRRPLAHFSLEDQRELKRRIGSLRAVIVWGKTRKDESRWTRLQPGDHGVFYHRWTYFELARVAWKTRNAAVAQMLWQEDAYDGDGNIGDMLIFYRPVRRIRIAHTRLHRALGWSEYPLRRFQVKSGTEASRALQLLERMAQRPVKDMVDETGSDVTDSQQ